MLKLTVVFAIFSCVLGIPAPRATGSHSPDGRIVGGHDANIADYPYQLSLIKSDFGHFCGATLIAPNWALTAAHCMIGMDASEISVRGGSSLRDGDEGQIVNVSRIIQSEDFDYIAATFDIALLELSSNMTLATPIALAPVKPAAGKIATITGWGLISETDFGMGSDVLQAAEVPVVDQDTCKSLYSTVHEITTDTMFCAGYLEGGIDACVGDSGGPLVVDGAVSGIISWGTGCAEPLLPGVYTDVASFRDWIEEHTGVVL